MRAVEVRDTSQIAEARRFASGLARRHGFDEQDAGRVSIVSSELASNIVKHGGGGELLIGSFDDETGSGVECIALDRGPGMADVTLSARDGHSTAGSAGNGLGAVIRGSHYYCIHTAPRVGTAILARLKIGKPSDESRENISRYGSICLPIHGEEMPGDGWCVKTLSEGAIVMVADGLGHGPLAADAAHAASRIFMHHFSEMPGALLQRMVEPMRATRGAAVSLARLDTKARKIVFAGVGNVAGAAVARDGTLKRFVSHNGTLGHVIKRIQEFSYPVADGSLMILCSDGLGTTWTVDRYPALVRCHPSLVAAVLYRDFTRSRDDVTVVVVRVDPL